MSLPVGSAAWTAGASHPSERLSPGCDVGAATADLADELLGEPRYSVGVATRSLDRLRRRVHALRAAVWIVTAGGVHRAVQVGDAAPGAPDEMGDVVDGAMAIKRLRRNGTIVCRSGEVSGVEELVPAGVKSFLAAAATSRGAVAGVLVLGWADSVPPCDETAAGHLRVAAALLTRTLVDADRTSDQVSLHEAVLASLSDPIAVVNRHGTIIAMNGAWTEFGQRMGLASLAASGPGVSYIEVCRRAAAGGSPRAADALEGIEAVCGGRSELFETAYPCHELGEEQWCVTRVTPLRRPEGGAVIAHTVVTRRGLTELAERMGVRRFCDLADMVPLREVRAKLLTAREAERNRIARELHDDLGQQLALLASRLDAIAHTREPSRNRMLADLATARKTLQDLATSIHNLSHELHPAKLKLLGLAPTLGILCRNLEAESTTHVSFNSEEVPSDVAEDSALCLFRVAQEALQNAVKHSGARHINVHLTGAPSQLTLQVVDDGGGFDLLAASAGLGLLTMRERVELLGGSLRIETGRSKGTRVEAMVPMSSSSV